MACDGKQTSWRQQREGAAPAAPGRPEVAAPCHGANPTSRSPSGDAAACRGDALSTIARLLIWLSPSYPVGSFSYSHGLEWVVEAGGARDAPALAAWIEDMLVHGSGRTDVVFLAEAWRATAAGDSQRLHAAAELAAAFTPSAERRLETLAQGAAFLAATNSVWPKPALTALGADGAAVTYAVAVGASAAAHGLPLAPTARAFCQAFAATLVSAGVRLIPLGQTDGLRVIARLEPTIASLVTSALAAGLDDLGGAAIAADIASMRHETQYTRLFRS